VTTGTPFLSKYRTAPKSILKKTGKVLMRKSKYAKKKRTIESCLIMYRQNQRQLSFFMRLIQTKTPDTGLKNGPVLLQYDKARKEIKGRMFEELFRFFCGAVVFRVSLKYQTKDATKTGAAMTRLMEYLMQMMASAKEVTDR
jgi:hypothetical protein